MSEVSDLIKLAEGKPMFGFVKGAPYGNTNAAKDHQSEGGLKSEQRPPVSGRTKLTLQQTASELKSRGLTLGKPTIGKDFRASYVVTDKAGNSKSVSAKDIDAFLKGKTKEL